MQRLGGEVLCFTYFCRTLLQFLGSTDGDNMDRLVQAEKADRLQHLSLDYLTRGRYHLAVNPRLGWEQVTSFRLAHGLGPPMAFPDTLLGRPLGSPGTSARSPHSLPGRESPARPDHHNPHDGRGAEA